MTRFVKALGLRSPEAAVAGVLVVAALAIGTANPAFWGWGNLFGLLRSASVSGIMALGVLLVRERLEREKAERLALADAEGGETDNDAAGDDLATA